MSSFNDRRLAKSLAGWLASKGCVVHMLSTETGFEVFYTLKEDVKPQPPVRINNGSVIFPKGSQAAVVSAFFQGGRP